VKLLKKFVVTPPARVAVAVPAAVNCQLPIANCQLNDAESAIGNPQSAMDLIIRPARRDDLETVSTLERGCFNTYTLSKRQLQYLQQRDTTVFLVAERAGQIVGEGIALCRRHAKQSPSGRAYSLAVDPAFRGQGIGERLMRAMLDELGRRAVRRIYLEVEATNAPAIHLYQRLGFRAIGQLPDYYGEGRPGLHMMYEVAVPVAPVAA
jgi:ribosomal protein S18 acetylase RimI-like enzyme